MKAKILPYVLILIAMFDFSCSKNLYFDKDANSKSIKSEESAILFESSDVKSTAAEAGAIAALIPVAIDLGFKITNNILEKNVEKFSSEYVIQRSYIGDSSKIPHFTFVRYINNELALKFSFRAKSVQAGFSMIYYIDSAYVKYSRAKIGRKDAGDAKLDYTIEIKPIFITEGKKTGQELAPISLSAVPMGTQLVFADKNQHAIAHDPFRHRTDLIMISKNSQLSEIHVKIVETNPRKVKAEKILETFTNYKDDAKTIINNFIGKEDEEDADETEGNTEGEEGEGEGSKPQGSEDGEGKKPSNEEKDAQVELMKSETPSGWGSPTKKKSKQTGVASPGTRKK